MKRVFNVAYVDKLDVADYAVPAIKAVSNLIFAYSQYQFIVGTNKEADSNVAYFLRSCLDNIANGLINYTKE